MKFGPLPVLQAAGAILAHSASIGPRRLAKGTVLSAADIAAASAAGIEELVVAKLEPGDIKEDDAAATIAGALAGSGLRAGPPVHGRVNLAADCAGIVTLDPAMVGALNAVDEALTLGTLRPFERVAAGDIVATVKTITFAVRESAVQQCSEIAAAAPLALAPFAPRRVLLVQTHLTATSAKLLAKTSDITRARAASLGLADWEERSCAHDEAALADVLGNSGDAEIILVAGASAITDRRDVIPAAIERAGGEVVRLGMPVDPGNLLCLGRIGAATVIGLPGCARSPKHNGFDWVLERVFAGLVPSSADIAAMGLGGLLAEVPRPDPRSVPAKARAVTGAVVLAAGRSVRMGANKLLADLGGRPVLAHVLDAVRSAGIEGMIVVTGHEAAAVAALARQHGAAPVHAERHAEGLSQSLAAGIRAVPADWGAAVVLLGDMPEVRADDIRRLAAAAHPDGVVVPVFNGKRGNPVAWGRRFFARLAQIEGDVGGKALLAEFADDVTEIEMGDDGILVDVDTPEALAAVRARHSDAHSS